MSFPYRERAWCLLVFAMAFCGAGCGQLPLATDARLPLTEGTAAHRNPPAARPSNSTGAPAFAGTASHEELATRFAAARQLEKSGDTQGALEAYAKISSKFPKHAATLHRLGVVHDKLGRTEQSLEFYRSAAYLDPKNAELFCDLGYSAYVRGDLGLAERSLRRAIRLAPNHKRAHNNLALVLVRQGKDQEAVASFQRAGLSADMANKNLANVRRAADRSAQPHQVAQTRSEPAQ